MKKLIGLLALTHSVFLHAGSMGPTIDKTVIPYLQGEGSYTWNQINAVYVSGIAVPQSKQPWGGRLSAGVMRTYNERIAFTGEVGGGYYGGISRRLVPIITNSGTIDGYDILLGLIYKLQTFALFGDIGFMAQNYSQKTRSYNSRGRTNYRGTTVAENTMNNRIVLNNTQIFPEIKVGGLYTLVNNLDISLSYMYVFGRENLRYVYASRSIENPALSTIFLGLRYNFA